jgi:hypothetical protein
VNKIQRNKVLGPLVVELVLDLVLAFGREEVQLAVSDQHTVICLVKAEMMGYL